MADPEHVAIVRQGAEEIQLRRERNPTIRFDLAGASFQGAHLRQADLRTTDLAEVDLRRADLREVNLSGANLSGADLREANLVGADLASAGLREANLSGANLCGANLRAADVNSADFRGANLGDANLRRADFRGANLSVADLTGADLAKADLRGTNLSVTELRNASLHQADLRSAILSRAMLSEADLSRANLFGADLRNVSLRGADLRNACVNRANLSEADLCHANLSEATLFGANLSWAALTDADFERTSFGWTRFTDVDLSTVRLLDTAVHRGPSTLGLDTLAKSKGEIPEVFLRGCGLSDWEVISAQLYSNRLDGDMITSIGYEIIDARRTRPLRFLSIFVSYSQADREFAQKLHDAFQDIGLRCWLDEHNVQPGEMMLEHVSRVSTDWDRVLLCTSQNSLTSWWIEDRIDQVLSDERHFARQKGTPVAMLMPVNLDNYLLGDWDSNVKKEVTQRVVADFTGWQSDADKFQSELTRTVKALVSNRS